MIELKHKSDQQEIKIGKQAETLRQLQQNKRP
jgi:hypothetical protein